MNSTGDDAQIQRKVFSMTPLFLAVCLAMVASSACAGSSFSDNYMTTSDGNHARILNNGQQVQLVLDQQSASGFTSKNQYLFGSIGMGIKLVPGNSAGTVTAYYMSSETTFHDELDFEFLGNVTGQPYLLQTNVYAHGTGNREQRISLWFDPTEDFHRYSVLWNKQQVIFMIDSIPIRVFKNNEAIGVPYPNSQPMGIYTSLWNGDQWATQGGFVKLNWTEAPFVASYEGFGVDACQVVGGDTSNCTGASNPWWEQSTYQSLANHQITQLSWVRSNYLVYDYCWDSKRFPTQPPECVENTL